MAKWVSLFRSGEKLLKWFLCSLETKSARLLGPIVPFDLSDTSKISFFSICNVARTGDADSTSS